MQNDSMMSADVKPVYCLVEAAIQVICPEEDIVDYFCLVGNVGDYLIETPGVFVARCKYDDTIVNGMRHGLEDWQTSKANLLIRKTTRITYHVTCEGARLSCWQRLEAIKNLKNIEYLH